ncbi:unnamed protein product [Cunninghamella echinulata]
MSRLFSGKFINDDYAGTTMDDSPVLVICKLGDGNNIQLFEPKLSSLEEMEETSREIKESEEVDIEMFLENFYKANMVVQSQ